MLIQVNSWPISRILEISLEKIYASVKIKTIKLTTPVNNVLVVLNMDSLLTNSLGIAEFHEVALFSNHSLSLERDGYNPVYEDLWIESDTTIEFQFFPLGIPEIQKGILLYPNPTNGIIEVNPAVSHGIFRITDPGGKILLNGEFYSEHFKINLSYLKEGMYIIQIISDDKLFTRKIIKAGRN